MADEFWTSANSAPKRNFRFLVMLGADIVWWAKTVSTPSYDVAEVEHNFLDNKFYFPGRVSWSDVSMTLVDPVSPDAVKKTNEYVIGATVAGGPNYKIKDENAAKTTPLTISKSKAVAALGTVNISILDPNGVQVEGWVLKNAWIKSAKYGDLDYSNDDLRTIELSIRYDWAECATADGTGQFTTNLPS
tara:strand:- start:57 stop:623 length:567 start_codon:yes stop_codon:yes gene_type:complete